MRPFQDRTEAGKFLAAKLEKFRGENAVVLALPRGGLPVAAEVALSLRLPLDILAVKKIGSPTHAEVALGAVSEDGVPVFDETMVKILDPERAYVTKAAKEKAEQMREQLAAYRAVRPALPLEGKTVILVDDGLATGATMQAAVRVLKAKGVASIVIAVPVASPEAFWKLKPEVTDVVALMVPQEFYAVGMWYRDFSQVEDEEALAILSNRAKKKRHAVKNDGNLSIEIERLARPLAKPKDYSDLVSKLAHARVVMLGESTHGTHEFYEIRARLTKVLVEEHGFGFIAVEGDWPDCYELNRYVSGRTTKSARLTMEHFQRWPTWMWANQETLRFVEWLRLRRANFYGLDVYSLFESIRVIRKYAQHLGPEVGAALMRRYSCFEPFERDEIAYARSLLRFPQGCREEVASNLSEILKIRLNETVLTEEELFNARQNARVIKNAENYYRAMLAGGAESWNVRDQHMMDTLLLLLSYHGPESKAVVWAHNTHVGDYRATDMLDEGYVNLGGLAREALGDDKVALVGFGTYGGEVRAGRAWGASEEVMSLPDARAGSYEAHFHDAALVRGQGTFCFTFDKQSRDGAFARRLGHRAVGVVYSPAYEISGQNYVPTELAKRYDAFVYVDRTSAVSSLRARPVAGRVPETWPSGQ